MPGYIQLPEYVPNIATFIKNTFTFFEFEAREEITSDHSRVISLHSEDADVDVVNINTILDILKASQVPYLLMVDEGKIYSKFRRFHPQFGEISKVGDGAVNYEGVYNKAFGINLNEAGIRDPYSLSEHDKISEPAKTIDTILGFEIKERLTGICATIDSEHLPHILRGLSCAFGMAKPFDRTGEFADQIRTSLLKEAHVCQALLNSQHDHLSFEFGLKALSVMPEDVRAEFLFIASMNEQIKFLPWQLKSGLVDAIYNHISSNSLALKALESIKENIAFDSQTQKKIEASMCSIQARMLKIKANRNQLATNITLPSSSL